MDEEKQAGGDASDEQRQLDLLAEYAAIAQATAAIGAKANKLIKGATPESEETKAEREKRLNAKYQADFRRREAEKEAMKKAAEAAVRDQLLREANELRAKVGLPEKVMPAAPEQLDLVKPEQTPGQIEPNEKPTAPKADRTNAPIVWVGVVVAVLLLMNLIFLIR